MTTTIEISTAQDVNQKGQITTESRLLAKLELHLPQNIELTPDNARDIRSRVAEIASIYALATGEVMQ